MISIQYGLFSVHGRLKNLVVMVGDEGLGNLNNRECGSYPGIVPQAGNVTITCLSSAVGRFVSVMPSVPVEFTLCELEVAATAEECQGDIPHHSICVSFSLQINIHTYIHMYIQTYMHTYIHTHRHAFCIHPYKHVMHACIHTYILHIYIHTDGSRKKNLDKIPPFQYPPGQYPPRTNTPVPISPRTKSPRSNIPPDNIPPGQIPPGQNPPVPISPTCLDVAENCITDERKKKIKMSELMYATNDSIGEPTSAKT